MKRHVSLFLCVCLLLTSFAGCSNNNNETTTTSSDSETSSVAAETIEAEAEETEETKYTANIPEGTKYDGTTFTIVTYPNDGQIWGDVDWNATEFTGETLNDAVFSRTSEVEDLLDVDIEIYYSTGSGDQSTLNTSVKAQDNAYQLYTINIGNVFSIAQQGSVQELNTFSEKGTLDLTAAWWDQNILNDLSINNMNFALTGDIGTMYKKSIGAMMFNKVILEQNQLESPYELMNSGKWTIDKMVEMGKTVSNDLDGNGVMDQSDQYGLICFCDMLPLAMIGCDITFVTKDADDIPQNTFYSDKSVSVVEKIGTLMYDTNLTYSWSRNGVGEDPAFKMFQTDKALFYYGELHAVATMREMESEFGIMPMPKYDETQDGYHHCVNPNVCASFVIPSTNVEYEKTGYIMDALGAASKNELTPAYFNVTLQGKVSRDEESQQSLEVIISTIRYDIGYLGGLSFSTFLYSMADGGKTDLASSYAKQEKAINKQLEKMVNKFDELKTSLESSN